MNGEWAAHVAWTTCRRKPAQHLRRNRRLLLVPQFAGEMRMCSAALLPSFAISTAFLLPSHGAKDGIPSQVELVAPDGGRSASSIKRQEAEISGLAREGYHLPKWSRRLIKLMIGKWKIEFARRLALFQFRFQCPLQYPAQNHAV